jgi:hypothetical protein
VSPFGPVEPAVHACVNSANTNPPNNRVFMNAQPIPSASDANHSPSADERLEKHGVSSPRLTLARAVEQVATRVLAQK